MAALATAGEPRQLGLAVPSHKTHRNRVFVDVLTTA